MKTSIFIAAICMMTMSCGGQQAKTTSAKADTAKSFTLPEIPVMLQSNEERAQYIVLHYWDNFNFKDTALIHRADITEQAFANYVDLFSHTSLDVVDKSVNAMLDSAITADLEMFIHMTELYEKYLHDPNSPFRQEDYYIATLNSIINNPKVEQIYKTRPKFQLEMAMKNRVGDIAANFSFKLSNGQSMKLSGIRSPYVILFFNNPDCPDCARVKEILSQLTDPGVKIATIYPDKDLDLWKKASYPQQWINGYASQLQDDQSYDLKAIPCLYLLDKDKRVVLKDAPVEVIIEKLSQEK